MSLQKRPGNEETMLRIAICDDTVEHGEQLARAFKTMGEELAVETEIDCYSSYGDLGKTLALGAGTYRLLVLDTAVGGEDGIEFARTWRTRGLLSEILFFSTDPDRALAAYAAYPMGYIIKPAGRSELREAFRFVARRYEKKPSLIIKGSNGKRNGFPIDDIIYIEVFRTELEVHSVGGTVSCTGALGEVYERLPARQFYRSHRSFIVNLRRIVRMEKYRFLMDDGEFVSIAKNRYAEAKKAWQSFCEGAPDPNG